MSIKTDVDYALAQLKRAQQPDRIGFLDPGKMEDCIQRAIDGLERVQEALAEPEVDEYAIEPIGEHDEVSPTPLMPVKASPAETVECQHNCLCGYCDLCGAIKGAL